MYSVDTNIFLDWWVRRYPEDLFPSLRGHIETLIGNGKWVAVERVSDELQHVAPPALKAWATCPRTNKTTYKFQKKGASSPWIFSGCRCMSVNVVNNDWHNAAGRSK